MHRFFRQINWNLRKSNVRSSYDGSNADREHYKELASIIAARLAWAQTHPGHLGIPDPEGVKLNTMVEVGKAQR